MRFYRAPIDPGYNQFGAAIAAGMGSVGQSIRGALDQNVERARQDALRAEERKRYEEQQVLAQQDRQISRAMNGIVTLTPEELAPQQIAPFVPEAIDTQIDLPPLSIGMAQGAQGGAGLGMQAGTRGVSPIAMATDGTGTGRTGGLFGSAHDDATHDFLVEQASEEPTDFNLEQDEHHAARWGEAGPSIGAAMGGEAPIKFSGYGQQAIPQVVGPDLSNTFTAGGETFRFDPERSREMIVKRAELGLEREVRDQARKEIRGFISRALADDVFSADEIAEAQSLGLDWAKLKTPEMLEKEVAKAEEARWKAVRQEKDYSQKLDHATIRLEASLRPRGRGVGGGGLIENAWQAAQAEKEIKGLAWGEAFKPGATPSSVLAKISPVAAAYGLGPGATRELVGAVMMGSKPMTPAEAAKAADAAMVVDGRSPYDKDYKAAWSAAKLQAMKDHQAQMQQMRDIWSEPSDVPAGFEDVMLPGGNAPVIRQNGPAASPAVATPVVSPVAAARAPVTVAAPVVAAPAVVPQPVPASPVATTRVTPTSPVATARVTPTTPPAPRMAAPDRKTIDAHFAADLRGQSEAQIRKSIGALGSSHDIIEYAVGKYAKKVSSTKR